jgi:hypothetical protein
VVPGKSRRGGSGLLAVAGKLFEHRRHLGGIEQHRWTELAGAPVLFAERLEFDAEVERLRRSSPSTSMPWLASRQARRLAIASSTASDSACVPKVA